MLKVYASLSGNSGMQFIQYSYNVLSFLKGLPECCRVIFDTLELIHVIGYDIVIIFKTDPIKKRGDGWEGGIKHIIP